MLRGLIVDLGTRATVEQAVEYTRVGFQAKVDLGYKCQGHRLQMVVEIRRR